MKDRAESGCPVGMCFCSVMSNSLVQGQAHGHWTTASGIAFSIVNSMLLFANCALLTLAVAAHSAPRRLFDSTDQKGLQSVQVTWLRLPRRLVLFRLAIGGPCKQWQRAPNSVPSEACFDLSPTAQRQFGWPGLSRKSCAGRTRACSDSVEGPCC